MRLIACENGILVLERSYEFNVLTFALIVIGEILVYSATMELVLSIREWSNHR